MCVRFTKSPLRLGILGGLLFVAHVRIWYVLGAQWGTRMATVRARQIPNWTFQRKNIRLPTKAAYVQKSSKSD